MKQLGNLAIVCAQRSDVLLEIHGGLVSIHMGQNTLCISWDDDCFIQHIIYELNFGKYANKR